MDQKKLNAGKTAVKSIAFATVISILGQILSKGSGFVREFVVSNMFDGTYRDAYYLAFRIPDLFFQLLVGGAIQASVTPYLASCIESGKEKKGIRTVSIFVTMIAIVMVIVCALGVIFSPQMFSLMYSDGYEGEVIRLAASSARFLFPQIFFMMLAALSIGILNAYKRFGSTSFGPTVYNICVVISIIIFAGNSERKLTLCMVGIMVSAIIYFVFQYSVGHDKLKFIRPCFRPTDPEFVSLLKRAIPVLISASIVQINLLVLDNFAMSVSTDANGNQIDGMISALRNATTVWQLPYGIFAVAVGQVMLPSLSGLYSNRRFKDASKLITDRIKTALFMTIPCAGIMFFANFDVIRVLFQWNKDNYDDLAVERGGVLLCGFTLAIVIQSVVFIVNQAFYAIGKTRVPLFAGIISAILNPILCWLLITCGIGMLSLTLAYSVTSVVQMIFLVWLYNSDKRIGIGNMKPFILKSMMCLAVLCAVIFALNRVLPETSEAGKIMQIVITGAKAIMGFLVYFAVACLLKMDEAVYWMRKLFSRFIRKK